MRFLGGAGGGYSDQSEDELGWGESGRGISEEAGAKFQVRGNFWTRKRQKKLYV